MPKKWKYPVSKTIEISKKIKKWKLKLQESKLMKFSIFMTKIIKMNTAYSCNNFELYKKNFQSRRNCQDGERVVNSKFLRQACRNFGIWRRNNWITRNCRYFTDISPWKAKSWKYAVPTSDEISLFKAQKWFFADWTLFKTWLKIFFFEKQ